MRLGKGGARDVLGFGNASQFGASTLAAPLVKRLRQVVQHGRSIPVQLSSWLEGRSQQGERRKGKSWVLARLTSGRGGRLHDGDRELMTHGAEHDTNVQQGKGGIATRLWISSARRCLAKLLLGDGGA